MKELTHEEMWRILHYIYTIGQHEDYLKCIRVIRFLIGLPLMQIKNLVDEVGSAQSLWQWKNQLD